MAYDRAAHDGSDDATVVQLLQPDGLEPIELSWREARHPRKVNFTYPEPDCGIAFRVTEVWADRAWRQLQALRASRCRMRNIAGQLNDVETQFIGRLGEIAVCQYYRWQGADVVMSSCKLAAEEYAPYDAARDSYDLVIGRTRVEVKTRRNSILGPVPVGDATWIGHLNRRSPADLDHHEHVVFCAWHRTPANEEVVQIMGWANGHQIRHHGRFVERGDCYPGDFKPQVANNWCIPYPALMPPNVWPVQR